MKKILQIAKLELSLLFYSPIAWMLMIVLFVQMALGFVAPLADKQHVQEMFPNMFEDLTFFTFTHSDLGIISQILGTLYIYIPLITMGIISRETGSGTIKLLYSSPVKISQIVYGKFISLLAYSLVLVTVMGLFVIAGAFSIQHFDYPHVLTALLACFLLLSTYSAIGIFVSSLTTYQVVAAIGTFCVLAFMNYVGRFGQELDFIRDLTYSLSMPSRTERMIRGLLNTRDVLYFMTIAGMFLAFTITKLELARSSKSALYQIGRYVLVVVIGLSITYISSRQPMIAYYDATNTKSNTISKKTQDILKSLGDDPVEITEYVNVMDFSYGRGAPGSRIADQSRWEPYLRFNPNIKMRWVYYYDSIPDPNFYKGNPGKTLKDLFEMRVKLLELDGSKFLTPQQIRSQINLQGENGRLVMKVNYKGKSTFLRTFADMEFWPSEAETGAAFKRLTVKLPKILFATDGYQRSIDKIGDRDYKILTNLKTFRHSMINQGFDVDTISLEREGIPKDITALVIADPKVTFSAVAMTRIQEYARNGGNMLIAGEPGKQNVINPLLESLGVQMLDGTIVQSSKDYSFGLVAPMLTDEGSKLSLALEEAYHKKIPISMPGVGALAYGKSGPFKAKPVLRTDLNTTWIKQGHFAPDSAALVFDVNAGDRKGAYPTALTLVRTINNKEQRILVAGDADFLSNSELGRTNREVKNFMFGNGIFGWFANGEFPIDATRPSPPDKKITLSDAGVKIIKVLYYGVIPGIMFLMGAVLLIRRKRK